ncbi:hypothetical protein EDD16DRAFT_1721974 [Pisolithus croceorrhizus]|nr:hypothetical protein EDD16DRAFT_1721974 [Pisolithus croceorrhizus]KAI6168545.1 hypothetical protein EDD17DRAFT_1869238 [Pisolithus thermaeus]
MGQVFESRDVVFDEIKGEGLKQGNLAKQEDGPTLQEDAQASYEDEAVVNIPQTESGSSNEPPGSENEEIEEEIDVDQAKATPAPSRESTADKGMHPQKDQTGPQPTVRCPAPQLRPPLPYPHPIPPGNVCRSLRARHQPIRDDDLRFFISAYQKSALQSAVTKEKGEVSRESIEGDGKSRHVAEVRPSQSDSDVTPHSVTDSSKSTPLKQSSSEAASVPTVEKTTTAHPGTPAADKSARGRQAKSPKDKATTRSLLSTNLRSGRSSPCSLRSASDTPGRRNHDRQPSPPLLPSSQAEGTNLKLSQPFARYAKNLASNSSDPFLTSSDSDSDHSRTLTVSSSAKATPSKLIYAHPSGKLARRNPTTPTPAARPVPVPRSNAPRNRLSLAHSAPSHSGVSLRQARFASAAPTRESTWQGRFGGPRTAPLATSHRTHFDGLVGASPPSPSHHRRVPSEGVFHMSFDEELSLWDTSEGLEQVLDSAQFASVGPSFIRAAKDKPGFFASSVFQNAPSPDELPPPAF